LIEIQWGAPLSLVVSSEGDVQTFTTIEQAAYWLRKKWPVRDDARTCAMDRIDAAMNCLCSVGSARRAFVEAARSAGFARDTLVA
jgi:hypothetical protein